MTIASLSGLAPRDLPQRLVRMLPASPRALARIVFDPRADEIGFSPDPDRKARLALLLGAALASRGIKQIVERRAVDELESEIGADVRRFGLTAADGTGEMALPAPGQRKAVLTGAGQALLAAFAGHHGLVSMLPSLLEEGQQAPEWRPAHEPLLIAALESAGQ